ncbi:hypothetical protein EZV73_08885 [Acidaminobacter sp. JC074]|uniref:endo alpha-1,4 polygalactosaminidase n=1 Tax=Acidaminobacter sp. JC074 TaxID=2530199 RepID=UPI001F10B969|nr:endo alpha-1,4 polygalactosaminidase [Acidaminobacter sp. JC074]MCH4887687.1 hypothetical protein [Acidaminobacter sp. JC074]
MKIRYSIVMILLIICLFSCIDENRDYRQDMRELVIDLSEHAKRSETDFIILPQNGQDLLRQGDKVSTDYLNAIDGIGREDLFYGYTGDNIKTPQADTENMIDYLNLARDYDKKILVVDYCSDTDKMDDSYKKNKDLGYTAVATSRKLNQIPDKINHESSRDIGSVLDVQNFLYLINPERYDSKEAFLEAIKSTNYDLIIIDAYFHERQLTKEDIMSLKLKADGGSRLIISYMSIGEAEDYRYYWQQEWYESSPDWLLDKNPDWKGNYKVKYWQKSYQALLVDYLDKIMEAGFDGVYLDLIDAYEHFEEN